jgi:hypothetical protein
MAQATSTATNLEIAGKMFTAIYMVLMVTLSTASFLTNQPVTGIIFGAFALAYPILLKLMINSIKKELAL